MAKTYQANNFTGEQLDDFMGRLLSKSFAGQGLRLDDEGVLHNSAPGYGNLLYSYTHAANKEVHPEGVNLATGVFSATAHGLTTGQQVFATMEPSFHIGAPYDYLPGGLTLGTVGIANGSTMYYVTVVDENSFYLSTASGGAALTFTQVSTMDLSKFHFEVMKEQALTINSLPQITEALIVVKGKIARAFRYVVPTNYVLYSGKNGFANYDKGNGGDQYGSNSLGYLCGWGSIYATIEMKFIADKHLLQITSTDTVGYANTNVPTAYHNRIYMHRHMRSDYIEGISIYQGGQFINGTTVEVYTK